MGWPLPIGVKGGKALLFFYIISYPTAFYFTNLNIVCIQFTAWVDAVIFVFSLESEASFQAVYGYHSKMAQYRNAAEIPFILVGTQGKKKYITFHRA